MTTQRRKKQKSTADSQGLAKLERYNIEHYKIMFQLRQLLGNPLYMPNTPAIQKQVVQITISKHSVRVSDKAGNSIRRRGHELRVSRSSLQRILSKDS